VFCLPHVIEAVLFARYERSCVEHRRAARENGNGWVSLTEIMVRFWCWCHSVFLHCLWVCK